MSVESIRSHPAFAPALVGVGAAALVASLAGLGVTYAQWADSQRDAVGLNTGHLALVLGESNSYELVTEGGTLPVDDPSDVFAREGNSLVTTRDAVADIKGDGLVVDTVLTSDSPEIGSNSGTYRVISSDGEELIPATPFGTDSEPARIADGDELTIEITSNAVDGKPITTPEVRVKSSQAVETQEVQP